MSEFIAWLEKINEKDRKVRAVLRQSLAFAPGCFPPAYPYVEPFLNDVDVWRREMYYLAAALWAVHWREGRSGALMSLGKACAKYQADSKSGATERRFITLLDADTGQLPNRLRQMISLLKDQNIDFKDLLNGLLSWKNGQKRTQNDWARDFYRNLNHAADTETKSDKEISE